MNITLIGMTGVGKSSVGKRLAKKLNYKFLDVDKIIEKRIKLKLQQIIDNFGDGKLLKIEEEVILRLGKLNNYIISPGGSAIYSTKAMEILKEKSVIVFLNTSFKNIERVITEQEKKTRGIIGLKKKSLKTLFNERLVLYRRYADVVVEVPEKFNINIIIKDIIQKIIRIS